MQEALFRKGARVYRLDTDQFPWSSPVSFQSADDKTSTSLVIGGQRPIDELEIRSIWYRREAVPAFPKLRPKSLHDACISESRAFLSALYETLRDKFWIDYPPNICRAEHKLDQLKRAQIAGLKSPRTLVTNDPLAAASFLRKARNSVVVKSLTPFVVKTGAFESAVFTTRVHKSRGSLKGLRYCPAIFQEEIDKAYDLRVTIVGNKCFSARIHKVAGSADCIDWRAEGRSYTISSSSLPKKVQQQTMRLLKYYGLTFGAVDFAVSKQEEYLFLELNPAGDWTWLPADMKRQVAEALASRLCTGHR